MIESPRRHGHFDPRWRTNSLSARPRAIPAARDSSPSIQIWENEGGRYSTNHEIAALPGLEWHAFSSRYFPGRRRHDLQALKAYEAYADRSQGGRSLREKEGRRGSESSPARLAIIGRRRSDTRSAPG
jgi:hypothetical protein